MKNCGKDTQLILSYSAYILSGFFIFSPIHKSDNIPLSLLCAFLISGIVLTIFLLLWNISTNKNFRHGFLPAAISICAVIPAASSTLMLLTEIIKDVAYIANRGISILYYTLIALAILFVSYYLCSGTSKGIFRFCVLSFLSFLLIIFTVFFALFSTGGIAESKVSENGPLLSPIMTGIRAGIFYTVDSFAFFVVFRQVVTDEKGMLPKKQIYLGFIISHILIFIYSIFTYLIFGGLTKHISDPDYALIKLIRGIDMTETVSLVRIVSFLVKSSVYIHLSAQCIKDSFSKSKFSKRSLILFIYSAIPATFLLLAFFDSTLEYGAFQHLIYPSTVVMSFFFILYHLLFQKKKK